MSRITTKDLAKQLGVTPSTISRALSGSPRVAEKTRQKVLHLARELNYSPNLWAQNLVHTASNIIGCLVLELSNPFYVPVVRAIESACHENNYLVFLGESQRNIEFEKLVMERFRRIRVAGIIATPLLNEVEHLFQLKNEGTTIILLGRSLEGFSSVNVNNIKSGELVAKHFLQLGYKHIGYVYSGEEHNHPEQERLEGMNKLLNNANLNTCTLFNVGKNDIEAGSRAAELWMSANNPPNAIFCSNDMLAMGFISYLLKHGVRVPEDVAVVGHDDVPFAPLFKVSLTTVAYPKYEVGKKAIELLMNCLQHPQKKSSVEKIILDTTLVIRDSCGASLKQNHNPSLHS